MSANCLSPVVVFTLLPLGGCQVFTDIFGPRWGPDVVEGIYTEDRSDGGEPWVLQLESGKSDPDPNAGLGDNGTDDGNVVVGTLAVGAAHNDDEAGIYAAIPDDRLVLDVRGIVAGFDLERDEPDLCGDGIVVFLQHTQSGGDFFLDLSMELVIDDDGEAEALTRSRGGGPNTPGDFPEVEVAADYEREEGSIVRPACRDNSDDESFSSPDSGGGDSDLFD